MRIAIGYVAGLVLSARVVAADFCVSTVPEFLDAMQTINAASEAHHLRIAAGEYRFGSADADYIGFGPMGALTIEGGFDSTCTTRQYGAQSTKLIAPADADFPPSFHAFGGDLTISDVSIVDFPGVYMWPQWPESSLIVRRTAILSKALANYGAVESNPTDGAVTFEDVVIEGTSDDCALQGYASGDGHGLALDFVTIRNHGRGAGVCFSSATSGSIRDSIVEANSATTIVYSNAPLKILNSVYASFTGDLDPGSSANLAGPVTYEQTTDALLRNRIADTSTQQARDSATPVPAITLDILGNPRQVGPAPDRGAFELTESCATIFAAGFDDSCEGRPKQGHSHHRRPDCDPICS